jgi:isoleucyl-tRNA synthetase
MHQPVPQNLDFPALENDILGFWERNGIFAKLRERNRGSGKRFRYVDGPITANNPMGVHHAWGRTYKDLWHRYKAMQGYEARYQNGFDCQGLWVEVEVEKELGFKSKRDIETYGIDKFVEQCKARVGKYSKVQTAQSVRLGYWMDWDNSYFTMAPDNNYAIWDFLKKCHRHGWIYKGRDVMPWCTRCGIALSDMEIATEGYREMTHKSVYIQLPIAGRDNEYLLVWTTTPWTLTSNTAVAVHPEFTYLKVKQEGNTYYLAKGRREILKKGHEIITELPGRELVGLQYQGPFDELPAQAGIVHRTVAWKDVTEDDGTGMVHIAPGCGQEDFALSKTEGLAVVAPLDEAGIYQEGFGWLTGREVSGVADDVIADLKRRGLLYYSHKHTHRYPECWRCHSELVFRLVDEWFISMEELRPKIMESAKQARWIPGWGLDRELDWLKNMGDWCVSKKRYWGLALPIFECSCGAFDVVGGYQDLKGRAVSGWDKFSGHTPHRPWVDHVKISCPKCGKQMARVPDVGNPWLDAGIVMYATVMDPADCFTPDKEKSGKYGYDPSRVYPANLEYWREWFPAEFITEGFPSQFRNWFYAILTMSTVLEGRSPFQTLLGHGHVRDEQGEEMHKSKGNSIPFDEAAGKIGADLMRWIFCCQNPEQNLNFGYHMAAEFKRKLLTLHNVYSFYVTYARLDGFAPAGKRLEGGRLSLLDRWILSELNLLVGHCRERLDDYDAMSACRRIETFVEDLSTWYVRRSRRRFWKSESDADKEAAYLTLYTCLETLLRLVAPMMPFWTEAMYQNLVRPVDDSAPESVHLCAYPEPAPGMVDQNLSEEMAFIRSIVSLGHSVRKESKLKVRQPLSRFLITIEKLNQWDSVVKYGSIVTDELNVKEVLKINNLDEVVNYKVKEKPERIRPKYKQEAKVIVSFLKSMTNDDVKRFINDKKYTFHGIHQYEPVFIDEVDILTTPKDGYAIKQDGDKVVAFDIKINEDLLAEGMARELVHVIQNARKSSGLDVSDRVAIAYGADVALGRAMDRHRDWIMNEVLATSMEPFDFTQGGTGAPGPGAMEAEINGKKITFSIKKT